MNSFSRTWMSLRRTPTSDEKSGCAVAAGSRLLCVCLCACVYVCVSVCLLTKNFVYICYCPVWCLYILFTHVDSAPSLFDRRLFCPASNLLIYLRVNLYSNHSFAAVAWVVVVDCCVIDSWLVYLCICICWWPHRLHSWVLRLICGFHLLERLSEFTVFMQQRLCIVYVT